MLCGLYRFIQCSLFVGMAILGMARAAVAAGPIEALSDVQLAAFHQVSIVSEKGDAFTWSAEKAEQLVLIVNWGSWCGACVAELPALARIQERAGDRLRIVLLSMPEHWKEDLAFAHARHLPFTLYQPSFSNDAERRAIRFSRTLPDGNIITAFPVSTLWTGDGTFRRGSIGGMAVHDADLVAVSDRGS
jgi:hypothetical protein